MRKKSAELWSVCVLEIAHDETSFMIEKTELKITVYRRRREDYSCGEKKILKKIAQRGGCEESFHTLQINVKSMHEKYNNIE